VAVVSTVLHIFKLECFGKIGPECDFWSQQMWHVWRWCTAGFGRILLPLDLQPYQSYKLCWTGVGRL